MNMNFCVVDETEHELQVLCEVDQLPGRVAWRAHIYGTVSSQEELSGEAVDHDAVLADSYRAAAPKKRR